MCLNVLFCTQNKAIVILCIFTSSTPNNIVNFICLGIQNDCELIKIVLRKLYATPNVSSK